MTRDRIRGALLGTAIGDALGMPIEGMSHQNVRTYYKGIKAYRADEKRGDLEAGQWTDDTQFTFALARVLAAEISRPDNWSDRAAESYVNLLPQARRWGPTTRSAVERLERGSPWHEAGDDARASDGAAMRAAPLGAWWAATEASRAKALGTLRPVFEVTHRHPDAVAAGIGQAFAVCYALWHSLEAFEAGAFWSELIDVTAWAEQELGSPSAACSRRLKQLADFLHPGIMPLDLQDLCDGTGLYAHEAWPFAAAMFARAPHLVEATLLSTVNVGGDADTTGAMTGALLGALRGWSAFPDAWQKGLEARDSLLAEADALADALGVTE